jgi:RND family efflux transporter MFP subunit
VSATGRHLGLLAALAALVLGSGFLVVHHARAEYAQNLAQAAQIAATAPPHVAITTVQLAPATLPLTLPGTTAAWYESVIYARVNGYVSHWNVDIGDPVRKGQVLATIDTPDLDAQLTATRAKLKADQALIKVRQAEADFAQSTYARWKDSPKGVVSEQEREAKKAAYESALAQLSEARAQVGLDQADIDRYLALTAFKQVISPYDGIVTERHIDIGNLVTAGNTANTPLYRIVQDDPMRVYINVPQNAAQAIKPELIAHIKVPSLASSQFQGKIARTANAISGQTRTLRVEVDLPNRAHALVSGMYVNAALDVPTNGLLQIPAAALVLRSNGPQVAVITQGRIDFRTIRIAHDDGNLIAIEPGSVALGEQVALNVGTQIQQGQAVQTQDVARHGNAYAEK